MSDDNARPESPAENQPRSEETAPPAPPEQPEPPEPEHPELTRKVCASFSIAKPYTRNSDYPAVQVTTTNLVELMTKLRHGSEFSFDFFSSHTVVDRIDESIFELVYHLYSMNHIHHLMISTTVPRDNPVVPTLCKIWKIAEWQEREAYDLFGILYDNHPDLRRVFLEDDWKGFPLRKDYEDDFMLTLEPPESVKSKTP